jgi:hypothetical protein
MLIMSEKIEELAKALSSAQGALENVSKDTQAYNYKYATLGSCLTAIRQPLKDNGLALSHLMSKEDGEMVLLTLLMHTSGQWIKSSFPLHVDMVPINTKMPNKVHAMGSLISYARRYSLTAIMGLAQEDDDGVQGSTIVKEDKRDVKGSKNPFDFSTFTPPRNYVRESPTAGSFPLLEEFKILCDKNKVNMVDFANFHKIKSTNLPQLKDAVENFESLYETYQLAKTAQAEAS